jgi:hypothetical protein
VKGLEKETVLDFLKFLYGLQKEAKSKHQFPMNPKDQDKVLELAKEMLNSTKGEELHIFKAVDDHVGEIVAPLDYARVCD